MAKNKLYYGDNLSVMRNRQWFPDGSVDLIYLDPPFKSDEDYNLLFKEPSGKRSAAQIRAFEDTWHWDEAAQQSYEDVLANAPETVARFITKMRELLGPNDMMAYLCMMAPRLVEMHRILKSDGSIYLHCDPNASHYLKALMDAVFGPNRFRREIVWRIGWVSGFKTRANNWVRNHEILLYYTKGAKFTFNKQYKPYDPDYERRGTGKPTGPGIPFDDVWNVGDEPMNLTSIMIMSYSSEKMSYPTQKPLNLLRLLIRASSNPGDVVLDPFCGCGTTIVAAHMEGRRWAGIDVTHLAVGLNKYRLEASFGPDIHKEYDVFGEPADVPGAEDLAKSDPYQFQWWSVGLVRGRALVQDRKRGPDKGVDGVVYFIDDESGVAKRIILQVKSGKVTVREMRELRGVVDAQGAEMGAMICLRKPTEPARKFAVSAGSYISPISGARYPRLQSITAGELLEGEMVKHPGYVVLPNTKRLERSLQEVLELEIEEAGD
ncbi:site-specific DNA-methyltransferase [Candidatus Saccharibacteria bacterium]|nr:site-specific DNA-methyltransferase [Candidatus Saccharibacteria bacterium]